MNATRSFSTLAFIGVVALGSAAVGWWWRDMHTDASVPMPTQTAGERRVLYYRNPMDASITSRQPARDSMGMDYIPVYADGDTAAAQGGVRIDARVAQNLGVRTAKVERRTLAHSIHTLGTVMVDESALSHFNPRASGWLTRLHVKSLGAVVERGAPLVELNSPELYGAQEDYRIARAALAAGHGDAGLVAAARARLEYLGVPDARIAALDRGAGAARTLTLTAPFRGVVSELNVREGGYVTSETRLYALADLARVWVNVDLYARDLPWVKQGDVVTLSLPQLPGREWQGRIAYLYPTLNAESRTTQARLVFDNADGALRPGMYADARIAAAPRTVLAVPREALIHAGAGNSILIAHGDGRFEPVSIVSGVEDDTHVEIVSGLAEGQAIVLSGQFLLDAEASFQGAAARMQGGDEAPQTGAQKP
jgi:Cu(I)/Ag(I) efflux system membrane fusion protein